MGVSGVGVVCVKEGGGSVCEKYILMAMVKMISLWFGVSSNMCFEVTASSKFRGNACIDIIPP